MTCWTITLALVIGCGGGAPKPTDPTSSVSDSPLELTFQAVTEGQRPVAMGSTLQSGDRIALAVTVTRPAHIYIIQFFPDGTAGVLFPGPGEEKPISGTQRIPDTGWFELDTVVGDEHVYVVASIEPLAQADAAVKRTVDIVRTSGKPPEEPAAPVDLQPEPPVEVVAPAPSPDPSPDPPPDPNPKPEPAPVKRPVRVQAAGVGSRPPPGGASLKTRGLNRVQSDATIRVTADEQGVGVFRFWFLHAAR